MTASEVDPALLLGAARRLILPGGAVPRPSPLPWLYTIDRLDADAPVAAGVVWPGDAGGAQLACGTAPPSGRDEPVRSITLYDALADALADQGAPGEVTAVLFDPRDRPADAALLDADGTVLVEAYALTSGGDVAAWGAWWPADGRAVTYEPPESPLLRDRVQRTPRVCVWRSIDDAAAAYAGVPWQASPLRLDSPRGRRLLSTIATLHT